MDRFYPNKGGPDFPGERLHIVMEEEERPFGEFCAKCLWHLSYESKSVLFQALLKEEIDDPRNFAIEKCP